METVTFLKVGSTGCKGRGGSVPEESHDTGHQQMYQVMQTVCMLMVTELLIVQRYDTNIMVQKTKI